MGNDEQLLEQLNKLRGSKTLIVGIGNTLKADDGAGPLVCQLLQSNNINIEVIDVGSVPENYIQPIVRISPKSLVIIDAVDFSASAGTIKIFEPNELSSVAFSTHTLSPHLFIEAICTQIDVEVHFIGIQPANLKLGEAVSPEVNSAIQQLVNIFTGIFPPEKDCHLSRP
jgi:hydrogenase 3 maturation protease